MGSTRFRRGAEMKLFLLTLFSLTPLIQMSSSAALASDPARLLWTASIVGSLMVLVYRLGVWRQEMESIRNNVGAEVKAYREQLSVELGRIDKRLDMIERLARRIDR